jgi:hypothetical protein
MKHPNRDEWAPYVFGEATAAETRRLQAHLEGCGECAAEVAGWQRSLKMLDSWSIAPAPRARNIVAPIFRWAVAAAIVLAAGVALGRMTGPDAQTIRAEVQSSVKSALAADFEQALARSEARLAALSQENSRELLQTFSETLEAARTEDRETLVALLQDQQRATEARFVNLRRDLETVALLADQELRQAKFTMRQLEARDGNY